MGALHHLPHGLAQAQAVLGGAALGLWEPLFDLGAASISKQSGIFSHLY